MIIIESLRKSFGTGNKKNVIVDNLSFHVQNGEVFGFLGPNGAGKSTTIKLLLGFLRADSGSMWVCGHKVGQDEYRHKIGYLPELPFFYSHLTALETLMVSGQLSRISSKEIKKQAFKLLSRLNLEHALHQRVGSFSKGMKQRLGMANALIHNPQILILDEPMSGLDPMGRYQLKELINELKAEGKTIFFSSHILSDIEELCDNIGVIHKGKLLYTGGLDSFILDAGSLEEQFIKVVSEDDDHAILS